MQFEELFALDTDYLQQLRYAIYGVTLSSPILNSKQSPVYGVIFLFKYLTESSKHDSSEPEDGTFDPDASERIFFRRANDPECVRDAGAAQRVAEPG